MTRASAHLAPRSSWSYKDLVRKEMRKRFRVNHYVPAHDGGGGFAFVWDHFDTREEAIAFLLDANLACAWDGDTKIAESVRSDQ